MTGDHPEVRTSVLPVACRAMVAIGAMEDAARDELARPRALAVDLGAEPITAEVDALLEGAPIP